MLKQYKIALQSLNNYKVTFIGMGYGNLWLVLKFSKGFVVSGFEAKGFCPPVDNDVVFRNYFVTLITTLSTYDATISSISARVFSFRPLRLRRI